MDQNLEKLVKLLEKDREIFQMLRQCPYEILRRFEVKDYEADQFVLNQGEIHNRFYIIASGYVDIYVESAHGKRYLLCTYMKGDYIGELENFGIPRNEMKKRIDDALELLDIAKYRDRAPFDLSGGQMQRMAIASIIAMNPEIIVLDEPTSQLDPQGSEEVFKAVAKLSEKGITVIMVEHKIEKIAAYSDRIMLLDGGKLVAFDTPQEIFAREDLAEHGVVAPVYTRICKDLGLRVPGTDYYPVTLDEAHKLLACK